jgi:hypothetical protein
VYILDGDGDGDTRKGIRGGGAGPVVGTEQQEFCSFFLLKTHHHVNAYVVAR